MSLVVAAMVVAALVVALRTDLFLSDLRPAQLVTEGAPAKQGRALLARAKAAHGWAAWRRARSVRFEVEQDFGLPGLHRLFGLPANPTRYAFIATPTDYAGGRYEVEGGAPIHFEGDQPVRDGDDRGFGVSFFGRGMRHLLELPFAMDSADTVAKLEAAEWRGRSYDRVFATRGSPEARREVDQYVLWIDKETGHIDRFDATGHGLAPPVRARVELSWSAHPSGLVVPEEISVFDVTVAELRVKTQAASARTTSPPKKVSPASVPRRSAATTLACCASSSRTGKRTRVSVSSPITAAPRRPG